MLEGYAQSFSIGAGTVGIDGLDVFKIGAGVVVECVLMVNVFFGHLLDGVEVVGALEDYVVHGYVVAVNVVVEDEADILGLDAMGEADFAVVVVVHIDAVGG